MKRTHYRNGDEIHLSCGCNSCSPCRINGVLCHETGCPDAWRDDLDDPRNNLPDDEDPCDLIESPFDEEDPGDICESPFEE